MVQNRAVLHTHLPLEAGDGILAMARDGTKHAVAGHRNGSHHKLTVDITPVILCRNTYRKILKELVSHANLHLREVTLTLVGVIDTTHITPHGVRGVVVVVIHQLITHRAVGGHGYRHTQVLVEREQHGDVTQVEAVVRRTLLDPLLGLVVVVVLTLATEVEQEALASHHTQAGRIEQVDRTIHTGGYADTSHRAGGHRTGRIQLTDTVHRIGREGVDAASLRPGGHPDQQRHSQQNRSSQFIFQLLHCLPNCTLKCGSNRRTPN